MSVCQGTASMRADHAKCLAAVVAHGDILRNIIDGHNSSRDYLNAEVKSFTFQSNDDYDAKLIEISEVAPEKATDEPTSSEMK